MTDNEPGKQSNEEPGKQSDESKSPRQGKDPSRKRLPELTYEKGIIKLETSYIRRVAEEEESEDR